MINRFRVDLTEANYSGGAGGTFGNLDGRGDWVVQGATPTFETREGLQGMLFSNLASERILGQMRALYEATVIIVGEVDGAGMLGSFGGADAVSSRYMQNWNLGRMQTFTPQLGSGYLPAATGVKVYASSWSPMEGKVYASMNDGEPLVGTVTPLRHTAVDYTNAWIGGCNFGGVVRNFQGWITRVLVFNRALHYRNPALLAEVVAAEMGRIGDLFVGNMSIGSSFVVG